MKILVLSNKFPYPPSDGGAFATFNFVRALADVGNVVDLLAMNTSKHYSPGGAGKIAPGKLNSVHEVFVDNRTSYSGAVFNLLFSKFPYNYVRFLNSDFRKSLSEILSKKRYDFVIIEGLYLSAYISIIKERSDALVVYRAHNIEHQIWKSQSLRENLFFFKTYLRVQYKRILKIETDFINRYDALITLTEDDLEALNRMGNIKPAIVAPFGIYPSEYPEKSFADYCGCTDLQYIGALDWLPNIEALSWFTDKVWPLVRRKYPEIKMSVAGRNPVRRILKKLEIEGVRYVGQVDSSGAFLYRDGILISPLFSGSGIRVKIIEAMFAGKPIIASSFAVSGIPVKNGIHMLLADTEKEFASCVERLVDNQDFALALGRNASNFARQHFDNIKITGGVTRFLKKTLA